VNADERCVHLRTSALRRRRSSRFLNKEKQGNQFTWRSPKEFTRTQVCTAERSLLALGSTWCGSRITTPGWASPRQGRATRQVGPRAPVKRDKLGIRRRGKRGPALTFPSRYTAYGTAGDPVGGLPAWSAGKVEEGSEVEFARRADERGRRQPERSLRREEMIANRRNLTVFKARLCDRKIALWFDRFGKLKASS